MMEKAVDSANNATHNDRSGGKWFGLVLRILISPVIAAITLFYTVVTILRLWINYNYRFIRYGAELVFYAHKDERTLIADIYNELLEQRQSHDNKCGRIHS